MTVADLQPVQLFGLIVFGCAFGVYMPLFFIQIYRESWNNWPWQTKTYFVSAATFLCLLFFGNFYLIAVP